MAKGKTTAKRLYYPVSLSLSLASHLHCLPDKCLELKYTTDQRKGEEKEKNPRISAHSETAAIMDQQNKYL